MTTPGPLPAPARQNRLLANLPRPEQDRLLGRMKLVSFGLRELVYRAGGPMEHVYFPISGVFSVVVVMADGSGVEVGTVGNEGMVGVPAYLGTDRSPYQVFCQVADGSWRMPRSVFVDETRDGSPLSDLLRRYTQATYLVAAQSVACNRLHTVDERCARWLLMTHDRVGADTFVMTQEFMGLMLGVRRASVTVAAGALQNAGYIEYTRGKITVTNRAGLEAAACECYQTVQDEFDRLIPRPLAG